MSGNPLPELPQRTSSIRNEGDPMLKTKLLATLFVQTAFVASSAWAVGPVPVSSSPKSPKAVLRVHLELEDGSIIQTRGALFEDGIVGDVRAKHAGNDSQLYANAEDYGQTPPRITLNPNSVPTPSANNISAPTAGYWAMQPVTCPHGRVLGYKRVWVRECTNCGHYHP